MGRTTYHHTALSPVSIIQHYSEVVPVANDRSGHYDLVYKNRSTVQVHFQPQIPVYVPSFVHGEYYAGEESTSLISPDASIVPGYGLSMAPNQPPHQATQSFYTPSFDHSPASTPPTDLTAVCEESCLAIPEPEDKIRFNQYMLYPNDISVPLSTSVFKK